MKKKDQKKKVPVPEDEADVVDRASTDSFPASDPPSWTGTVARVPCEENEGEDCDTN
jgi:hypothetical protein